MDAFVRKLVRRLNDESRPLSRNRHFHTFDNDEGKKALRISRRLQSLRRDILACRAAGETVRATAQPGAKETKVEILIERLKGKRTALLSDAEFSLLLELPGMKELFDAEPD